MTLKSFRNTAGLSVSEAHKKTGIPLSTLYAYEKQNALPNTDVASKLAAAYDLPFRDMEPFVREAPAEPNTREILEEVCKKNLPQVKMITDAEYRKAVEKAINDLRRIIGGDNSKSILLAVGFVTANIENRLFITGGDEH